MLFKNMIRLFIIHSYDPCVQYFTFRTFKLLCYFDMLIKAFDISFLIDINIIGKKCSYY